MNWIKFLLFLSAILTDQVGLTSDQLMGLGTMAGSSILGATAGGSSNPSYIEPYPGYFGAAQSLTDLAKTRANQPGVMSGIDFNTAQPAVETATQNAILGQLSNLPKEQQDIMGTYQKYSAAHSANEQTQFNKDLKTQQDQYNRLGLASSTPGLQAQTDLRNQQSLQLNEDDMAMMTNAINQEMTAATTYGNLANQAISQGQTLGASQRSYENTALTNTYNDWLQAQQQPLAWANAGASILGQTKPLVQQGQMNTAGQIATTGQDIGKLLMQSNVLGQNQPTTTQTSTDTGGGVSNIQDIYDQMNWS